MFPGVSGFLLWLLIAQLALLLVFGVVVALLARRAPHLVTGSSPTWAGTGRLIALLAFLLGGLLSAAINLGVAGLLGTAVPGRLVAAARTGQLAVRALAGVRIRGGRASARWPVPWWRAPSSICGTATTGSSSVAPQALARSARRARSRSWRRLRRRLRTKAADAAPGNSRKVAKAWAVGLLADDAARAVAWLVGGGLIVLLAVETIGAGHGGPGGPAAHHRGLPAPGRLNCQPHHRWRWPRGWSACCAPPIRTPQSGRPSARCGTWRRSGRGPCTRSPRRATASVRYLRSWTGCCCMLGHRPGLSRSAGTG